jgi:hypothetical protein
VLVQPAEVCPSHQPGEARLLQTVTDELDGGAHTAADLYADADGI